jgi:hypothetical protein
MFKFIKNIQDHKIQRIDKQVDSNSKNNKDKIKLKMYNKPIINDMAVLLCYFNPCKYNRIIQNALTVKHLFDAAKIPYFIAEIKHNNDETYFFSSADNIFQYSSNSYIFYKENLINTLEKNISKEYSKICIIDFDIIFDNPDWYSIISDKLNNVSVTQPFKNAYFLNLDYSVLYNKTNCIDNKITNYINYAKEHSGFIWAFKRDWFNNYNFDDKLISSFGDTLFANNITKKIKDDIGSIMYYKFSNKKEYNESVDYDSCDLNTYHLNHGLLKNRQYTSINKTLYDTLNNLNIKSIDELFVRRDDNILEFSPEYITIFNKIMIDYFNNRNDDDC